MLGSSAEYNMRSALWPAVDWNTVAAGAGSDVATAAAAQSSSAVMSQCRQPSSAGIIQPTREPYADMLGIHAAGTAGAQTAAAEFGDLASMFTGFIE